MKKVVATILSLTIGLMVFGGCGNNNGIWIDPNRTQLYVSNYNGGYGSDWLTDVITRFEADFADISYEDGKTGVQIIPSTPKTDGISLFSTFSASTDEVFFNEKVYYNDYVDAGYLLPITDIVEEKLTAYGEGQSIADKMTESQREFLKASGDYYAIPHYEGYTGIVFDVDLFESEGYYFSKNGGFVTNGEDETERSAGPDGNFDTAYDNGLPTTYAEFYQLLDKISGDGYIPIGWTGANPHYVNLLATALQAAYEGPEQMMLNYSFSGTAKNLISVHNGEVVKQGAVELRPTTEDGWKVYGQAGRYYALQFIEKMVSDQKYYTSGSFSPAKTQTGAQEDFLMGRFSSSKDRIAMHVDGVWWENEAIGIFNDMAQEYGSRADRMSRKFALMPLPKADKEGEYNGTTLYNNTYSYGFINSSIAEYKIPLAKAFLQYCNTYESLKNFVVMTNAPKAIDFEYDKFTEAEKASMTYFGRSTMEYRTNAEIVQAFSNNDAFLNNQSQFILHMNMWQTKSGKQYPANAMRAADSGHISAEEYFNDIQAKYTENYWKSSIIG